MDPILWWQSKTFYANIIAAVALLLNNKYGIKISPELQVAILAVVNLILRAITKQPIVWTRKQLLAAKNKKCCC